MESWPQGPSREGMDGEFVKREGVVRSEWRDDMGGRENGMGEVDSGRK